MPTKISLGELFPEEGRKAAAVSLSFDGVPLTQKDVLSWKGARASVSVLADAKTDITFGLRATGALLEGIITNNALANAGAQGLVFVHENKLYLTQAKVLLIKAENLLTVLRSEEGVHAKVFIEKHMSRAGRSYYDFKVEMDGKGAKPVRVTSMAKLLSSNP